MLLPREINVGGWMIYINNHGSIDAVTKKQIDLDLKNDSLANSYSKLSIIIITVLICIFCRRRWFLSRDDDDHDEVCAYI